MNFDLSFTSEQLFLQEFFCVLHGFLYFLSIPSMSMLLMIYSLGNLHVVSWGTREVPKKKTAEEMEAEKKEAEEEAKKPPKKKTGIAGKQNYLMKDMTIIYINLLHYFRLVPGRHLLAVLHQQPVQ